MLACIFPGQGSQYIGMGKDFFERYDYVKEIFNKGEEIIDLPIKKLCFEGPLEELTLTENLQVCLTIINISCFSVLLNEVLDGRKDKISFVAGHSLGEYTALWASEVLSLEETLIAVKMRGEIMQEAASKALPSGMYAIIGLPEEEIQHLIEKVEGLVVISNYNSPKQLVISGELNPLEEVARLAKEKGAKTIKLKVSAGFHSPLMKEAEEKFSQVLENLEWKDPIIPFVSNVSGKAEFSGKEIKALMKKQITSSVRWISCVKYMYGSGVKCFVETGPKKVLCGLVSQILENLEFSCFNVEDVDSLKVFSETIKHFL